MSLPHRISRRTAALALALAFGLIGLAAACGQPARPRSELSGAELFALVKCDACHGPGGAGTFLGPRLERIAANWSRADLSEYIRDPAPFRERDARLRELSRGFTAHMRAFPELSDDERDRVADWLSALP